MVRVTSDPAEEATPMKQWTDQEPELDLDSDQGSAVFVLDGQEQFEAADLLEFATMTYRPDGWTEGTYWYNIYLAVEPTLLARYTPEVCEAIRNAVKLIHLPDPVGFSDCIPHPKRVLGDWRELRRQGRVTGINNQANGIPLPTSHPKKYGLNFRDSSELLVFEAFERAQKRLSEATSILVAPNAGVYMAGRVREVDFLVTYRGRAGVVEVDGSTHHNRWAADQSRDRMLQDAGISVVERIVAEDTNNPDVLDKFVQCFLDRLLAR
jgi:hypothetical protein